MLIQDHMSIIFANLWVGNNGNNHSIFLEKFIEIRS